MSERVINTWRQYSCGSSSEILTFGVFTDVFIQFPDRRPQQPARKWNTGIYFQELSNSLLPNHKRIVLLAFPREVTFAAAEKRINPQLLSLCQRQRVKSMKNK